MQNALKRAAHLALPGTAGPVPSDWALRQFFTWTSKFRFRPRGNKSAIFGWAQAFALALHDWQLARDGPAVSVQLAWAPRAHLSFSSVQFACFGELGEVWNVCIIIERARFDSVCIDQRLSTLLSVKSTHFPIPLNTLHQHLFAIF